MKRTPFVLVAAVAAAALAGCSAQPTTADLSAAASDRLKVSAAQCVADAAAEWPDFYGDPARQVAQMGCETATTCVDLARYVDNARVMTREPRYGQEAAAWLGARYESAGCREVAARVEAAR